jgi:nitroimidazol reductase NimA-like FMN-containing flavoprotein (pyridoxamine 5'-phosphate oxidase superfamily)
MRANPKVCKEVDEIANQFQRVSVVIKGTYDELKEPHNLVGRAHARMLLGAATPILVERAGRTACKTERLGNRPAFL